MVVKYIKMSNIVIYIDNSCNEYVVDNDIIINPNSPLCSTSFLILPSLFVLYLTSALITHEVAGPTVFPPCISEHVILLHVSYSVTSAVFTRWAQPASLQSRAILLPFKSFLEALHRKKTAGSFLLLPLVLFAHKRRSEAILFVGWKTERCRDVFFVYCFVMWLLLLSVLRGFFAGVVCSRAVHTNVRKGDKCSDSGEKKRLSSCRICSGC